MREVYNAATMAKVAMVVSSNVEEVRVMPTRAAEETAVEETAVAAWAAPWAELNSAQRSLSRSLEFHKGSGRSP